MLRVVDSILLLVILKSAHTRMQSGFLMEPKDQAVMQGQNATFYCDTLFSDVYWVVTGDLTFSSDLDPHSGPHYIVDGAHYNIALTVFTSEQVNNLTVVCHFITSNGENCASRTAYMFAYACSPPIQEPVDQEIVIGRNASFDCLTRSRFASWMILQGDDVVPIEEFLPRASYTLRNKSGNGSFNTTLTVISSEEITNLSIACSYHPMCITTAHLLAIPCSESVPTEHLVINKTFYNEALNVVTVLFEVSPSRVYWCINASLCSTHHLSKTYYRDVDISLLSKGHRVPLSCENLPINYTVFMSDSAGRIVSSSGPFWYNGLQFIKVELHTTLEYGHNYNVYVELQISGLSIISTDAPLNPSNWINTTTTAHQGITTSGHQDTNITRHHSGLDRGKLTLTVAVLGTLVGVLLVISSILLGATAKRCKHRSYASGGGCRMVPPEAMVTNPIYDIDGPMYESIQQQFDNTNHGANTEAVSTPPQVQNHYVIDLPGNNSSPKTPKYIESPGTAAATPTDTTPLVNLVPPTRMALPTDMDPPTGVALTTAKERNKLHLTLTLHEGELFVPKSSTNRNSGIARHGTLSPDLTSKEGDDDDNYTFMSPPEKAQEEKNSTLE